MILLLVLLDLNITNSSIGMIFEEISEPANETDTPGKYVSPETLFNRHKSHKEGGRESREKSRI